MCACALGYCYEAVVLLFKTFISLPTYYYYFHVLSCIASPPFFFDFKAVSGCLLAVILRPGSRAITVAPCQCGVSDTEYYTRVHLSPCY